MSVHHDFAGWLRLLVVLPAVLALAQAGAEGALRVDPNPLVVNVPGSHAVEDDLARGAKVILGPGTALKAGEGFTDPAALVDGEDADGMLVASAAATKELSVTIDLGRPRDICDVRVMTADRSMRGTWADAAEVLVSDDGEHFTLVAKGLSGTRHLAHIWDDTVPGNYRDVFSDGGTVTISGALDGLYLARGARYVRVQMPRPDWRADGWKISEIDVDGTPGIVIPRAGKVKLDGELGEWAKAPAMRLGRAAQVKMGKWGGPADLSGKVQVMLGAETLYVAADVTKRGGANNDLHGEAAVAKDCVELFVELRDLKNGGPGYDIMAPSFAMVGKHQESGCEYQVLLNPGGPGTQPQIWFCHRDSGLGRLEVARVRGTNDAAAVGGEIRVRDKADGKGYVLEAAIPLSNFGKSRVAPGMQIGLDAAIDMATSGGRLQMVWHAAHDVAARPEEWGRAWVERVEKGKPAAGKAVVRVDGDVARTFNGVGEIRREIFGMEPNIPGMNRRRYEAWRRTSQCFGRFYITFDPYYGGLWLPGLDGKTEAEKAAIVRDPAYWRKISLGELGSIGRSLVEMAKVKPKNVFLELWCAEKQFEADPAFGVKPAALTPERQALLKKAPKWRTGVEQIVGRAGPDDRSMSLNRDRDLYADIIVHLIGKIREIFPRDTKFYVTLSNETNWLTMFWNKPILDDFFDSLKRVGDYEAGPVAAREFLSQYNPLYRAIKRRYPDVLVGCPDVCAVDFTDVSAGRQRWRDFVVPILDGAAGMDFFDYHYGVLAKHAQVIHETVAQYLYLKRGIHVPSVDSEAGTFTFVRSIDPLTQMRNGITNAREWFGWLRDPDVGMGWAAEDVRGYFDGFGQPETVAMPMVMFEPLRGKYIECASDEPGVSAVASLDGKRMVTVALNDRPDTRQVEMRLQTPAGATITRIEARMLWHDFRENRTRYATFRPRAVSEAGAMVVEAKMPAFALGTIEATLDRAAKPSHTAAERRYAGDRVVFWVEPGKSEKVKVELPKEALAKKGRRYMLRIGYERAESEAAVVTLNGKQKFVLAPQTRTSGWDLAAIGEFAIDPATLRTDNEVSFEVAPGKERYAVDMLSIVVQDEPAERKIGKAAKVTLDPAGKGCKVTEEPARYLPAWYVKEEAAVSKMPPVVAEWSFDAEKKGVVADESGHGHDGKLMNGAALVEGVQGKALALDGKQASMKVADAAELRVGRDQSFSIAFWAKYEGGRGLILHKGGGDFYSVTLKGQRDGSTYPYPLVEGQIRSGKTATGGETRGTMDMSDGKWHHYVLVRDAPEEAFLTYVDGKYEGSGSGRMYGGIEGTEPLFIGARPGSDCMKGAVDEVVIYRGALTPRQVAELYARRGKPGR